MAKFKVGDKVRVIANLKSKDKYFSDDGRTWDDIVSAMMGFQGKIVTISGIECGKYLIEELPVYTWTDEMFSGLATDQPRREFIVIHRSGNVMTAEHRVNREVIKSAKATCAPSDTFDFDTGAKLAFDRLMGREEPKLKKTKPPHHWIESKEAERRSRFSVGDRVVSLDCEGSGTVIGFERDGNIMHGIDWVYVEWDKYPNRYNPKLEKNLRAEHKPATQPAHRFKVGDRVETYFGNGTVIFVDPNASDECNVPYLVKGDNFGRNEAWLGCVADKSITDGRGCKWFEVDEISPAPAPKPPKYYTGSVFAIKANEGMSGNRGRVNRVFEVVNGIFAGDYSKFQIPAHEDNPFKSFDDICERLFGNEWREVKE